MDDHQHNIDSLLERYLGLLDEYTSLRERLSTLQSGVYHNIARANFAAERGMRYGQDQYDERMQAVRILSIDSDDETLRFTIKGAVSETEEENNEKGEAEEEDDKPAKNEDDENTTAKTKAATQPANPLRWFGVLAPMPLRNAQSLSIEAVEQVIPRLVTVNAEMLNLEIEVRRARKKRTKAAEKKTNTDGTTAEGSHAESQSTATPVEVS